MMIALVPIIEAAGSHVYALRPLATTLPTCDLRITN